MDLPLKQWIEKYEKKTGDKFCCPDGFKLLFLPSRGFAQIKTDIEGKMIIIYQLCGDAHFWHDIAEVIAVNSGLECIATICTRKIEPYIRFWGWKIDRIYELPDGLKRYFGYDKFGRPFVASPKNTDENGETSYYVCHYMLKGVIDYGEERKL